MTTDIDPMMFLSPENSPKKPEPTRDGELRRPAFDDDRGTTRPDRRGRAEHAMQSTFARVGARCSAWGVQAVCSSSIPVRRLGHNLDVSTGMNVVDLLNLPGCDLSQLLPEDAVKDLHIAAPAEQEVAGESQTQAKAA